MSDPRTGYAAVNGLQVDYVIHGADDEDAAPCADDIRHVTAPTLIGTGDADASVVEHAVAMFRLMGGGRMGDMNGIGRARLAVLPGTAHFMPPGIGVLDRTDWLLAMIPAFLDAPQDVPAPTF